MAEEPRDRNRTDRKSNTTSMAAVIAGLVVAVLAIWWLVGGFDGGEEQIAAVDGEVAEEQVGAGVEGEMAPAVEGDLGGEIEEVPAAEGEAEVVE